eukprot:Hpha_TRINITY_DN15023_c1_g1::TRINITY_DN15023_c1_g1_i1::g.125247::m.125247
MSVLLLTLVGGGLACTGGTEMEVGYKHTCATFKPDGQLRCWGMNVDGALGVGDTVDRGNTAGSMSQLVPVPVSSNGDTTVKLLSLGESSCVVVGIAHTDVKCWGNNDEGALGLRDVAPRGVSPGQVAALPRLPLPATCASVYQLAVYRKHVCVLCDDAVLIYCVGGNKFGQLGVGDNFDRGNYPSWGTPGSQWTATDLGGVQVTKLLRGNTATHTCAVTDGGGMKCWGDGSSGQLGYGVKALIGTAAGDMGASLAFIDLQGRTVRDGCVGNQFTCALFTSSKVECWGTQGNGVLGNGQTSGEKLSPNGTHVDLSNALQGEGVEMIACGGSHVCALSLSGSHLACWGGNSHGQLGYDDRVYRGGTSASMSTLPAVLAGSAAMHSKQMLSVGTGSSHTCVLFDGGTVMCWGEGTNGQLGSEVNYRLGTVSGDMAGLTPIELGNCTEAPTVAPTHPPTSTPSTTTSPTSTPSTTTSPTLAPTHPPTSTPSTTTSPTFAPTHPPTSTPSTTTSPTFAPTHRPTSTPSSSLSPPPTSTPSTAITTSPTLAPSTQPSTSAPSATTTSPTLVPSTHPPSSTPSSSLSPPPTSVPSTTMTSPTLAPSTTLSPSVSPSSSAPSASPSPLTRSPSSASPFFLPRSPSASPFSLPQLPPSASPTAPLTPTRRPSQPSFSTSQPPFSTDSPSAGATNLSITPPPATAVATLTFSTQVAGELVAGSAAAGVGVSEAAL